MTPTTDAQLKRVRQILLRDSKIDNFSYINTKLTTRIIAVIYLLKQKGYEMTAAAKKAKTLFIFWQISQKRARKR